MTTINLIIIAISPFLILANFYFWFRWRKALKKKSEKPKDDEILLIDEILIAVSKKDTASLERIEKELTDSIKKLKEGPECGHEWEALRPEANPFGAMFSKQCKLCGKKELTTTPSRAEKQNQALDTKKPLTIAPALPLLHPSRIEEYESDYLESYEGDEDRFPSHEDYLNDQDEMMDQYLEEHRRRVKYADNDDECLSNHLTDHQLRKVER